MIVYAGKPPEPDMSRAKEIKPPNNHASGLCWDCQKTSRYKCSWFLKKPYAPEGAEYYRRPVKYEGRTIYVITSCPNFKREYVEFMPIKVDIPHEEKERKKRYQKCVIRFQDAVKPAEKIRHIDDKPQHRIPATEVRDALCWVAKITHYGNYQLAKEIDCNCKTVGRILSNRDHRISVETHNKIAEYVNRVMEYER